MNNPVFFKEKKKKREENHHTLEFGFKKVNCGGWKKRRERKREREKGRGEEGETGMKEGESGSVLLGFTLQNSLTR